MSNKSGFVVYLLGCALFAGCGADGVKHTRDQKGDTIVLKEDAVQKHASPLRDTVKKQETATPEINEEAIQRAVISKRDSSFQVYNNIRADYRIVGYQSPDTNSRKMVLFSIFTSDVKDNPYQCPYGSYYGSPNPEELVIKYTGDIGAFIKADIGSNGKRATVYFEKKWVEFDQ